MAKEFDEEKLREIANASIKETIFRSINTTLTTLLPIICLIVFGSREIIEFNIAIVMGLIVGLFSSVFLSCSLMIIIERMITKNKPKKLFTFLVVLFGVICSMFYEAGYVIFLPIAAILFMNLGRHPAAGVSAAFAGMTASCLRWMS